jgi:hypothetical protein
MQIDVWAILSFLGQSILASGVALFAASTRLGERFLNHHFDKRLATFKHDQEQAIEELRAKLEHISDRGKRSNEREFSALSGIWEKLIDAYLATNTCVSSLVEYPDLNSLTQDEVTSFLNSTEFSEAQKTQIAAASDKNEIYSRVVNLRQLNRAGSEIYDCRLLLRKNGIFVPQDIISLLENAIQVLHAAQVERYIAFRHDTFRAYNDSQFLLANGEKIIKDLGVAVRARLLKA